MIQIARLMKQRNGGSRGSSPRNVLSLVVFDCVTIDGSFQVEQPSVIATVSDADMSGLIKRIEEQQHDLRSARGDLIKLNIFSVVCV